MSATKSKKQFQGKNRRFRGDVWLDEKVSGRTMHALQERGVKFPPGTNVRGTREFKDEYKRQLSKFRQEHAEKNGFSVVRDMVGHGVGRNLHEDPSVPNYGRRGVGVRLKRNMTIAIEPMINMGGYEVDIDGWKCVTSDGKPSAHYENTVLIGDNGVEILTL